MRAALATLLLTACVSAPSWGEYQPHRHVVPMFLGNHLIGTGVVLDHGVVVTAGHVADMFPIPGKVRHPTLDLAVIKMDTTGQEPVRLAERSTGLAEEVVLVAWTGHGSAVLSTGFTGLSLKMPAHRTHTCEASPGTSGGAMLNKDGGLVGIQLGCFTYSGEGSDPEGLFLPVEAWVEWAKSAF